MRHIQKISLSFENSNEKFFEFQAYRMIAPGALWKFIQSFEPVHDQICILRGVKFLINYDITA